MASVEAMDGEILSVTFDSADVEESQRQDPYVHISQFYEIPGPPSIEWHDGEDYDGGAEILKVALTRTQARIDTDRIDFSVTFSVPDQGYSQLVSFLTRLFPATEIVDMT